MEGMRNKNLKSLQNIIDEMHSDRKLGVNQTFSLKSNSDMIKNVDKFISSYRKNNRTIDFRDTKRTNLHPTDKKRRSKARSIYK